MGGRDEQLDRALASQPGKVELLRENVAQWIQVKGVELLGTQMVGPLQHQFHGLGHARAAFAAG